MMGFNFLSRVPFPRPIVASRLSSLNKPAKMMAQIRVMMAGMVKIQV